MRLYELASPGLSGWKERMSLQKTVLDEVKRRRPWLSLRRQRKYALRELGWKELMLPSTFEDRPERNVPRKWR